jgi:hypothetical protein
VKAITSAIICIILTSASFAEEQNVDWKFYGGAREINEEAEYCFYDAKGVTQDRANHLIRVWTKCLARNDTDINSVEPESDLGKKVADSVAKSAAFGYQPPYASIRSLGQDDYVAIIWSEAAANITVSQPRARIFYELDCSKNMIREQSIFVQSSDGKLGHVDTPRNWQYVPPETNGTHLTKLLCP